MSVSGAMKRGKEFGTSEFRQKKRVWNLGVQTEEKSLEPQSSDSNQSSPVTAQTVLCLSVAAHKFTLMLAHRSYSHNGYDKVEVTQQVKSQV